MGASKGRRMTAAHSLRQFASLAACVIAANAQAWIDTGHMVVAAIALDHLKLDVRKEIEALFAEDRDAKTNSFIPSSCWADDVKTPETGPWHYKDIFFRADGKPSVNKPDEQNAVWAIDKFSKVLADRKAPKADRLEALKFLVHIVGDLHQPLHCVARETEAFPKGDRGGNDFKVTSPAAWNPAPRNLHFLWDMGGGLFMPTARPLLPDGSAKIGALRDEITRMFPIKSFPKGGELNPEAWLREGLQLCKDVVYNLPEGTVPSPVYLAIAQAASARQVALGGYRLAGILNKLLD